jgi:hypothetical protein
MTLGRVYGVGVQLPISVTAITAMGFERAGLDSVSMTGQVDYVRRRIPGMNALPGAGFLNDRLNDVVILLTALPEIVVHLRSIGDHVVHLDDEVVRMRTAVDRLENEVLELRGEMTELGAGINEVCASVGRLEPHISDISRIARPLKRRRRSDESHPEPKGLTESDPPPLSGLS